jgi:hypothetical protein
MMKFDGPWTTKMIVLATIKDHMANRTTPKSARASRTTTIPPDLPREVPTVRHLQHRRLRKLQAKLLWHRLLPSKPQNLPALLRQPAKLKLRRNVRLSSGLRLNDVFKKECVCSRAIVLPHLQVPNNSSPRSTAVYRNVWKAKEKQQPSEPKLRTAPQLSVKRYGR